MQRPLILFAGARTEPRLKSSVATVKEYAANVTETYGDGLARALFPGTNATLVTLMATGRQTVLWAQQQFGHGDPAASNAYPAHSAAPTPWTSADCEIMNGAMHEPQSQWLQPLHDQDAPAAMGELGETAGTVATTVRAPPRPCPLRGRRLARSPMANLLTGRGPYRARSLSPRPGAIGVHVRFVLHARRLLHGTCHPERRCRCVADGRLGPCRVAHSHQHVYVGNRSGTAMIIHGTHPPPQPTCIWPTRSRTPLRCSPPRGWPASTPTRSA